MIMSMIKKSNQQKCEFPQLEEKEVKKEIFQEFFSFHSSSTITDDLLIKIQNLSLATNQFLSSLKRNYLQK